MARRMQCPASATPSMLILGQQPSELPNQQPGPTYAAALPSSPLGWIKLRRPARSCFTVVFFPCVGSNIGVFLAGVSRCPPLRHVHPCRCPTGAYSTGQAVELPAPEDPIPALTSRVSVTGQGHDRRESPVATRLDRDLSSCPIQDLPSSPPVHPLISAPAMSGNQTNHENKAEYCIRPH